jgi:hypothetical protein
MPKTSVVMERILSVTKRWCVLTLWRLEVFTLLEYCTAKISRLLQTLWDSILVPLQGPSCLKRIMEQVEACLYMEQCYCLSAWSKGNGETIQLLEHWLERQTSFWTISVDYGTWKLVFLKNSVVVYDMYISLLHIWEKWHDFVQYDEHPSVYQLCGATRTIAMSRWNPVSA